MPRPPNLDYRPAVRFLVSRFRDFEADLRGKGKPLRRPERGLTRAISSSLRDAYRGIWLEDIRRGRFSEAEGYLNVMASELFAAIPAFWPAFGSLIKQFRRNKPKRKYLELERMLKGEFKRILRNQLDLLLDNGDPPPNADDEGEE